MALDYNPAEEIELARQTERAFRMAPASRAADVQARTESRFLRHLLVPVVALILGIIAGVAIGQHIAAQQAAAADWTVPACKVYAFTAHPDLPPYTRTDVCYTENGDGGYTLSTGDHQWTAGY